MKQIREQREREQREKEQREKEQREFLEKEERERHLAQLYAAEMQRNFLLSGQFQAASQRPAHSIGMGMPFPPNVHGLPTHMTHPFGHIAAMTGYPSLGHTSQMPSSINYPHTSPSNPTGSLNLSHSRTSTAPSPVAETISKSRSAAPSPAHSASNIPSLPKQHYPPPHKYPDMKKHSPITSTAPPPPAAHEPYNISNERHANSSSNRNSSNHNNSNSSHFNAESLNALKSAEQAYIMHEKAPKLDASQYDAATNCKYSISLEKINSKSVTSNETRSEPMELSVSTDAPQAKFISEQISPRKFHLSSDNKLKTMHFTNNDGLNNGCQERSAEVKDLSGQYSSYESRHQYNDTRGIKSDDQKETSKALTVRSDLLAARSPDNLILSKEPIVTNTNSTSLEHDSTISNSDTQQIKNNKDSSTLSKVDASDTERYHSNVDRSNSARTESNMSGSIENDAATTIKSPYAESPKLQPLEAGCESEKSPSKAFAHGKLSDTSEPPNDAEIANKSTETVDTDGGTAVAVENSEPTKQAKT